MAIDDLAGATRERWDLEAELLERSRHAIDRGLVFARVARVRNQVLDRPNLDSLGRGIYSNAPEYQFAISVVSSRPQLKSPA
jgi:hypothetical protein